MAKTVVQIQKMLIDQKKALKKAQEAILATMEKIKKNAVAIKEIDEANLRVQRRIDVAIDALEERIKNAKNKFIKILEK